MTFKMIHENYNVSDLDRSLAFYRKALGLTERRRITGPGGSFVIVYVGSGETDFELELTWLREHPQPYGLGECEFHLAFRAEDFDAAHALHEKMDCICFENPAMGIYFIQDPDGYWLEILPTQA
ncbi:MAG: VOC family protein [Oscillibacter sp.]|nr:VOC family protein [Oscillibacter sp.]